MLAAGLCAVIGFEPQADALAQLERMKGPRETYLPYAVADGRAHTLHICRERGMTSLLRPDRDRLGLFNEFSLYGLVEQETKVSTRRLDDIKEIEHLDFLKIDVQGAELNVFKAGRRLLGRAVAIQTEVSFVQLYQGQPAFGAIDTFLRSVGFIPHCFAELKLRPLAPLVFDSDPHQGGRQLLEADMVYVRDFTQARNMDAEQWKHLAMVAHHCCGSVDLAHRALVAAAQLGAVRRDAADQYVKALRSSGIVVSARA
jgi:FkbM family methyltransferase